MKDKISLYRLKVFSNYSRLLSEASRSQLNHVHHLWILVQNYGRKCRTMVVLKTNFLNQKQNETWGTIENRNIQEKRKLSSNSTMKHNFSWIMNRNIEKVTLVNPWLWFWGKKLHLETLFSDKIFDQIAFHKRQYVNPAELISGKIFWFCKTDHFVGIPSSVKS